MEGAKDPTAVRRYSLSLHSGINSPVGLGFKISDEASYEKNPGRFPDGSLHQQKRFEFAKTRLNLGSYDSDCDCGLPVSGNLDASTYLTRMTIGKGKLRPVFEGLYKLGSFAVDPEGDFRGDLVSSENNAGFKMVISKQLMAYLKAGIASRVSAFKGRGEDLNFDILLGFNGKEVD